VGGSGWLARNFPFDGGVPLLLFDREPVTAFSSAPSLESWSCGSIIIPLCLKSMREVVPRSAQRQGELTGTSDVSSERLAVGSGIRLNGLATRLMATYPCKCCIALRTCTR